MNVENQVGAEPIAGESDAKAEAILRPMDYDSDSDTDIEPTNEEQKRYDGA